MLALFFTWAKPAEPDGTTSTIDKMGFSAILVCFLDQKRNLMLTTVLSHKYTL
ncbi:MAG: hypothetical protein HYV32_03770 [Candidatus Kerfeldbacteria bacterium]|nr:hypothetical protein [Candidatus Kerfeldbacteria bacterium]